MSARAVPFHCPYCGEENLFPHDPQDPALEGAQSTSHGAWECRSCLRAFRVSMIGQLRRPAAASTKGAGR
jgi:transposase-like protein